MVILIRAEINGEKITHHYTPINVFENGEFECMIKIYKPCEEFKEGGKVTQYINNMKIGDKIQCVKGNYGKTTYLGRGEIEVMYHPTF